MHAKSKLESQQQIHFQHINTKLPSTSTHYELSFSNSYKIHAYKITICPDNEI